MNPDRLAAHELVPVAGLGRHLTADEDLALAVRAVRARALARQRADIGGHDRVGAILFSDRIERYIPPRRGRRHVLAVVRDLLWAKPASRGTDIAGALTFLSRVAVKRAIEVGLWTP